MGTTRRSECRCETSLPRTPSPTDLFVERIVSRSNEGARSSSLVSTRARERARERERETRDADGSVSVAPRIVPFMCTKLSPCCDTVTPLAVSDAISLSSFWILFVSAIASASASGEECGRGDADGRGRARVNVDIGRRSVVRGGARGTGKGELEGGDAVDGRDDARARDGVVLVDDECDEDANEGETCERWRDARWRCARAR